MQPFGLRLYSNVLASQAFVADLSDSAMGWKRSIRAVGGFWQGAFKLAGDPSDLMEWFYTWLGFHLEERSSGVTTWEGMVYEMELLHEGVRRRRTLALLANAVKARYTDAADETSKETGFATEASSIARYGRREEALTLGKVTAASATARRDTALKEGAWPWARPVGANVEPGRAELEVRAAGYAFTMNWKYVSVQDGATGNVSTYINDIIATDAQFVSVGNIRTNTLQVKRATALAARAWDTPRMLTSLGDASGNPYLLWVDVGRKAYYEKLETAPRYYLHRGGLRSQVGEALAASPWLVRPGVVRDAQYPVRSSEPGSFLADVRDIFVEEVEVDARGKISLRTSLWSEAEMLDAQAREQERR